MYKVKVTHVESSSIKHSAKIMKHILICRFLVNDESQEYVMNEIPFSNDYHYTLGKM
jgi:hypothetical protein